VTTSPKETSVRVEARNGKGLIPKTGTGIGPKNGRLWKHGRTNPDPPSLGSTSWIHPDLWRSDLPPEYEDQLLLQYADSWRFAITAYYATLGLVPEPQDLLPLFPAEISTRLTHRFAAETEVELKKSLARSRQWGEKQREEESAQR
jgi:hypothetical protein